MSDRRLPASGTESIRRDRVVTIRFERRRIRAFEGDTVGSALAAAGVDITARSFKYHRPRGLLCMTGSCPNCLMQIDRVPNVRACTEPVRDGMRVARQNAWPSAGRDIHGWLNTFSFMMPPGFYYKVFQRPRWAWPLVEPFIRSKAGLGHVPREEDHRPRERINLHPDVLVIGAGAAGLAAAAEASAAGADTMVLEEGREPGGHRRATSDATGDELIAEAESAGARILLETPAFGVFAGPLVAAAGPDALYRIRARHLVFATGAVEQPAVFPNSDRPGIMLSSAVELLINRYRVLPGRRAVVLTAGDAGYRSARTLIDAGASAIVVDTRPAGGAAAGVEVVPGSTIQSASGRRRVTGVTVGPMGATTGRSIPCDLVVVAGFSMPSTNLLAMTGAAVSFDEVAQAYLPDELPPNVHAAARSPVRATRCRDRAGTPGGVGGGAGHRVPGRHRTARLASIGRGRDGAIPSSCRPRRSTHPGSSSPACAWTSPTRSSREAVDEGFSSMELLKRYTTITMGPCQGKACMLPSQRLCAKATGSTFAETRPTTARPPWTPVELGTLAGPRLTPRKETTIHDRQAEPGRHVHVGG